MSLGAIDIQIERGSRSTAVSYTVIKLDRQFFNIGIGEISITMLHRNVTSLYYVLRHFHVTVHFFFYLWIFFFTICFISQSQSLELAIRSQGFLLIVIPVTIMQCRVEIGIFNAECKVRFSTTTLQKDNCTLYFCSLGIRFVFDLSVLLVYGHVKVNLGLRKRDTCYNLSVCHWSLNSIAIHNFEKINLLLPYDTVSKFEIV